MIKNIFLPIIAATLWISLSEFARNEFWLKNIWVSHYDSMGLIFPSAPLNGIIWGIWSLMLAVFIYVLTEKFSFLQVILITWMASFVMMWLVTGNLNVLPLSVLFYAIPLSLMEVVIAAAIVKRLKSS